MIPTRVSPLAENSIALFPSRSKVAVSSRALLKIH